MSYFLDGIGADKLNGSYDDSADPMTDTKHEPMRETDDTTANTQYEKLVFIFCFLTLLQRCVS